MNSKKQRGRLRFTTIGAGFVVILAVVALVILPNADVLIHAQGDLLDNIPVDGNFWMPNGGWIELQGSNFGMSINKTSHDGGLYDIYGHGWAPNLGWISFRSASGNWGVYIETNDPTWPVEGQGPWNLEGYAWGPNIGWINFDAIDDTHPDQQPRIVLDGIWSPGTQMMSASLAGYAWAPNIGWIDLSYADIDGWVDVSNPELISWSAAPEVVANPARPYLDGVYVDKFLFDGYEPNNFIWVADDTKFKVQINTQDNNIRWQSLMIAHENGAEYFWKDKLHFTPRNAPYYRSYLPDPPIDSFFERNPDYPAGFNPTAIDPQEGPWQSGEPLPIWQGVSHLQTNVEGLSGTDIYRREIRLAARDGSGNDVCKSNYQWGDFDELRGCQVSNTYGNLANDVGIAVDTISPEAKVKYKGEEYQEGDHIPTDNPLALTYEFGDTKSSGARWGKISWSLNGSEPASLGEWDTPDASRETVFRNFFLPAVGGNDGDTLTFRLEACDNVGNCIDESLNLVVDNSPPTDVFEAQDPEDLDPSRTRFQTINIHVPNPEDNPLGVDVSYVRFSNAPEEPGGYQWGDKIFYGVDPWWPFNTDLDYKFDLNSELGNEVLPGGNKMIYAEFGDNSIPANTVIKSYLIKAPWFQAEGGDIHAGEGIGSRKSMAGYKGLSPYSGESNAAYRITADGKITPQIVSAAGVDWESQSYQANFNYPGPAADSIAQIDWEALKDKAIQNKPLTEAEIIETGVIDFSTAPNGVLWADVPVTKNPIFQIGDGSRDIIVKGKGTLLVPGTVYIKSNLYYEDGQVSNVNDISSLGIITRRSSGLVANQSLGNLYVDTGVSHIVGAYILGIGKCQNLFGNSCTDTGIIHTSVSKDESGAVPSFRTDFPSQEELTVKGLVIARGFDLGRYSTGSQNFLLNADFSAVSPQQPKGKTRIFPALPLYWRVIPEGIFNYETVASAKEGAQNLGDAVFLLWETGKIDPEKAVFNQVFSIPPEDELPAENTKTNITASVYLKSNQNLKGFASLAISGNTCASGLSLTNEWTRYQCQVENIAPGSNSVSFDITFNFDIEGKSRTVYVAAPQVEYGEGATNWHLRYEDTNYYSGSSEKFYYDGRAVMNTPPGLYSLSSSSWGEATAD